MRSLDSRRVRVAVTTLALAAIPGLHPVGAEQQGRTTRTGAPPTITAGSHQTNWASHNLDPYNQRYAELDQINTGTVDRLQRRWSFDVPAGLSVSQVTPLVVDGLMYFHSGTTVLAINAVTGKEVWTLEVDGVNGGVVRGPLYASGTIYSYHGDKLVAADAKTGELVESFGDGGVLPIFGLALQTQYLDVYPPGFDASSLNYRINSSPAYHDNTLYVGSAISEGNIPGPVLFDVTRNGETIKGVGAAGKNCLLYLWHRETGEPINPMVETLVSTETNVPGEVVYPTQPIPHNARGVPLTPFCATYLDLDDPELQAQARQMHTPYSTDEHYIVAHGGSSFGSPSFSPRTGLLYVTGKNAGVSLLVKPLGDSLKLGEGGGHAKNFTEISRIPAYPLTTTLTAYEPASEKDVWQQVLPAITFGAASGSLTTAGDLVLQGTEDGGFYAFYAETGAQVFHYDAGRTIRSSPLTYEVNGTQYVAVIASNTVLAFALPQRPERPTSLPRDGVRRKGVAEVGPFGSSRVLWHPPSGLSPPLTRVQGCTRSSRKRGYERIRSAVRKESRPRFTEVGCSGCAPRVRAAAGASRPYRDPWFAACAAAFSSARAPASMRGIE